MIIAFSANASKPKNSEKSVTVQQTDPKNWTNAEVDSWFKKGEWLNGWKVKPDESIDKRKMAESYYKFKSRWDMAFKYLKDNDLTKLKGTHNLDGTNVYVIAVDYNSKDKSDTRYESHKRYVDIQYIAVGEEQMGKTTDDNVEVAVPYSEANDITYYKFDGGNYYKATPKNFFIFFPGELHRPSIKLNESVPIKRIVVKVLVE